MRLLIVHLVLLMVALQAQAQTQAVEQVNLPPLPNTANTAATTVQAQPPILPPTRNNTPEQTAAQTVGHLINTHAGNAAHAGNATNNGAQQQPPVTPAQAMHDPLTEGEYFSESTYGTVRDPAFENMLKKMYPMSPAQIAALRETHETTQRAMNAPAQPVPTPTVTTQVVNLSPGTVPPVLRLSTGYVSSVVFVDDTGAPWPVAAYSIGDPTGFNIQWDQQSNLLLIQGQKPYATGNMAVTLQGMPTPVMLTIVTDQGVVDYRVDFRVQGRGPNARGAMIASSAPQNANATLMNLLEGVAPQESQLLTVTGGSAQAWLWNNQLYVRTPLTLLSPGWVATLSSADGTHVYQLPVTPMILASSRGEPVTLKVEGL
jgi:intracellular multiplication protein IcmK